MATTLVTSVSTQTTGNLCAQITHVDPDATHLLKGTISSSGKTVEVSWDAQGYCLDQTPDCNLNIDGSGLAGLLEAALKPTADP